MELDNILPQFQVNERHSVTIQASNEEIFSVLLDSEDIASSVIFKTLIKLRELPTAFSGQQQELFSKNPLRLQELMQQADFAVLGGKKNQEIVFGFIGQFWNLFDLNIIKITSLSKYLNFKKKGYAKAAINFYCEPHPQGSTLSTETRIYLPDKHSLLKFRLYWFLIRPFSGLIRQIILKKIKRLSQKK